MNILILSCGTRNKIVQYFRANLSQSDKVIATDCSEMAPALYEADAHYIVPRITEPHYLDCIYDICRKEQISAVLSLIDPELSLLAEHEAEFKALGVTVIGSDYDRCEMSLDKYRMYCWLKENGYNCARSYMDKAKFCKDLEKGLISFPVFVKPAGGSASIAISKVDNMQKLDLLFDETQGMMIQEFMSGQEIGADVYIDMISGEVVSIFTKKKVVMRAGETDKAISFKDEKLFELVSRFASEAGFRGQIDIDIFDIGGKYYISEVNPRFGGGYPHAYESGANHMALIINNLKGQPNKPCIGDYREGTWMMKYNEVMVRG